MVQKGSSVVSVRKQPFEGFDDWVSLSLDSMAGRAIAFEGAELPATEVADLVLRGRTRKLHSLARSSWSSRRDFERDLGRELAASFNAFDAGVGLASAYLRLLEPGRLADVGRVPPDNVSYALVGLGVEAQAVSHEIDALLRAGFGVGARARWRSLYELLVVSEVLALGNRHTHTRFVQHRWIMLARDSAHDQLGSAGLDYQEIEREKVRLLHRFGSPYGGSYGWAAELTNRKAGVKRPKFKDLESLVTSERDHASRVLTAHHAVHIDSYGILMRINKDGTFHAGPEVRGLAASTFECVLLLGDIVVALMRNWNRYAASTRMADAIAMAEVCFSHASFVALEEAVRLGEVDSSALDLLDETSIPSHG